VEARKLHEKLAAEFFGSMFLVMAAISSMILFDSVFESPKGIAVFASAVAVAFVLCALIEIFAPFSGAHFNPVVTMVILFEKKIILSTAALFILVQFIGGLAGTVLSHLMFLDEVGNLFTVSAVQRTSYIYFGEVICTFILVFAVLLLVKTKSRKISLIVGFLVGGQFMATSSTMFANPQVTVARMFTNSAAGIRPSDGLIFIAMQVIGALLAYGTYKLFFAKALCD